MRLRHLSWISWAVERSHAQGDQAALRRLPSSQPEEVVALLPPSWRWQKRREGVDDLSLWINSILGVPG
ncbi:hypothetical protein NL676_035227 [Syzygium grande]|nr:hypothetical protein NL676_035227 [Syzygium grande]